MTRSTSTLACLTALASIFGAAIPVAADDTPHPFDAPWIGYDTSVYPNGYVSWASRSGDFNQDGTPDLAIASWPANSLLTILFGDGKGGYADPVAYSLPLGALDLETADFDNDGDLDLVISNTGKFWEGTSVQYFKNDGNGTFTAFGQFAAGNGPTGLTAADFNNDGFIDVATAHDAYIESANTFAVLLNAGGNGFQSPQIYTTLGGTRQIAAGDIDGDSDADLIVAHESNRMTIHRNNGGTFVQVATLLGPSSGSIPEQPMVHAADIDLDGDIDLLFANTDTGSTSRGAMGIYRNDGTGSFGSPEVIQFTPFSTGAVGFQTGDVTGDGWPDIVATCDRSQMWMLLRSNGSGGFLAPREFHAGEDPHSAEITDLNGDGLLDITIVGRGSLEACVYLNPGGGDFVQPDILEMVDPALAPVSYSNLQTGDVDGDGDLDLVTGWSANFNGVYGITVRRNNGDGTFAARETYSAPVFPGAIRLADMDGDSDLDLLWFDEDFNGRFRLRMNDGSGNYGPILSRHALACEIKTIEARDVDNDGDLDVILGGCYAEVAISKNLGNTNFGALTFVEVEDGGGTHGLGFGDFNDDGNLDLLTPSGVQGYAAINFGNGDGTFGQAFTVPTGRDVKAFDVGDLDHDGDLDFVAVYNLDGNGITSRIGRGDGNFFAPQSYHGSNSDTWDNVFNIKLGDADGDGELDAMVANFGSQDISFWKGVGDGSFNRIIRYGVGGQAKDLSFGDFTGDGRPDVAVLVEPNSNTNGWYYPGIVILRGATPGGSDPVPATLDSFNVFFGSLLSGGIPELEQSDDAFLRTRSSFGFSALEPNLMELRINFTNQAVNPTTFDLTIEARINNPSGVAKIRFRDWSTNGYVQVDQLPLTNNESVETITNIDAGTYVRASDGRIDLSVKHVVNAVFSALGFDSSFDQIRITAE